MGGACRRRAYLQLLLAPLPSLIRLFVRFDSLGFCCWAMKLNERVSLTKRRILHIWRPRLDDNGFCGSRADVHRREPPHCSENRRPSLRPNDVEDDPGQQKTPARAPGEAASSHTSLNDANIRTDSANPVPVKVPQKSRLAWGAQGQPMGWTAFS